ETASTPRIFELREPTRDPPGAQEALRADPRSDRGEHDDQRSGARARDGESEHADPGPSGGGGDRRDAAATLDRAGHEAASGEAARSEDRAARQGERTPQEAVAGSGRHDDGGRGDHPQPARASAGYLEDLVVALQALAAETEQRRRSGTNDNGVDAAAGTRPSDEEDL